MKGESFFYDLTFLTLTTDHLIIMKRDILILLLNIAGCVVCMAQTKYVLTARDKMNYTLSIDQQQISKANIAVHDHKRYGQAFLPVKLTNNSNDTLKYISMTCDWDFLYQTDNKDIQVPRHSCYTNFNIIKKVPPHQSFTDNVRVDFQEKSSLKTRLKMSLYLKKYVDKKDMEFPDRSAMNQANFIWSNEIEIPIRK